MDTTEYLNRKFASGKPRKCWMCGCVLNRWTASVDHLQPQSKGGKDSPDNYSLACKPCNSERGNTIISQKQRLAMTGRPVAKKRDFSQLAEAIRKARND